MNDLTKLQYICPNCFSQKATNDVLFCRNAVKKKPDYRKRYFWHVLHPRLDGPENTGCFADWRAYPANQRLLRGDLVLGVTDYAGDTLTQRACPECHYPIANPWDQTLLLLPWSEAGMDFGRGMEFFSALGQSPNGWQVDMLQADPEHVLMPYVRAVFADHISMQFPTGLMDGNYVLDEGLLAHYQQTSNASIVWLKLDAADSGGTAADLDAIDVLLNFSEIDAPRGDYIGRPTVIFLCADETLPEQPSELENWVWEKHHNLLNAFDSLFLQFHILAWQENFTAAVEKAADWLVQTSFGAKEAATKTGRPETSKAAEDAELIAVREEIREEETAEEGPWTDLETEEDMTDD